jgi:hypothetical protein
MRTVVAFTLLAAVAACAPAQPGGETHMESSTQSYLNARGVPQSCTDQLSLSDIHAIYNTRGDAYMSRHDKKNRIDRILDKACG